MHYASHSTSCGRMGTKFSFPLPLWWCLTLMSVAGRRCLPSVVSLQLAVQQTWPGFLCIPEGALHCPRSSNEPAPCLHPIFWSLASFSAQQLGPILIRRVLLSKKQYLNSRQLTLRVVRNILRIQSSRSLLNFLRPIALPPPDISKLEFLSKSMPQKPQRFGR